MILNWQITRPFASVRMGGYAPWAPPPGLPAGSVLRPVVGLRRVRRGSVWIGRQTSDIGSFVVPGVRPTTGLCRVRRGSARLVPPRAPPPFTLFAQTIVASPRRPRRERVQLGTFLTSPPAAPAFTLFTPPIVRIAQARRRNGRSLIGPLLSPQPPYTLFTPALVYSVRRPRRGLAWLPWLQWPYAAAPAGIISDPNRATAVLIRTADLGYAQSDANQATAVVI